MAAKQAGVSTTLQENWGIVGHAWAVHLLKQHAAEHKHKNAYLITGPIGVGRRTLALRFTQALNCPTPTAPGEPCRTCQTCRQIEAMLHPDLSIIQADRLGGVIRVDQIRELLRSLSLTPYAAPFRVAVLLRFEEANPNAANALLKTLEEPPPRVVLVLTAESPERLMPTIVSRCEVIRLVPVPAETIYHGLVSGWAVSEDRARLLAHICDGSPGLALRFHQDPSLLERRRRWLEDHSNLLFASYFERFDYAEKLARDKEQARATLATWLSVWRDVMLAAGNTNHPPTNLDWEPEVVRLASNLGLIEAKRLVQSTQKAIERIDRNITPRLVLEVYMLDLPAASIASLRG